MGKLDKVLILTGPTASGKTKTAIDIAKKYKNKVEIINFDSLLFYKELNIGTAKPSKDEQQECIHHLVGHKSILKEYNAAKFCQDANKIIKDLHLQNKVPLLVGGSGFYLRALLKGMFPSLDPIKDISEKIKKMSHEQIREELKKLDPDSYNELHQNDHYRNERALQFYYQTSQKISELKKSFNDNEPYNYKDKLISKWETLHLHLDLDKEAHFQIIQQRTQKMLQDGLVCEVKELIKNHTNYSDIKPLNSIGYKETIQYLQGEIEQLESLSERINISTRQLAKAQRTFFAKSIHKKTFSPLEDSSKILNEVELFFS